MRTRTVSGMSFRRQVVRIAQHRRNQVGKWPSRLFAGPVANGIETAKMPQDLSRGFGRSLFVAVRRRSDYLVGRPFTFRARRLPSAAMINGLHSARRET